MPDLDSSHPVFAPWQKALSEKETAAAVLAPDGSLHRTFGDIEREAVAFVELWAADLPPRSIVAVQVGNSPAWPAIFLALLRLDCITVPLGADAIPPAFVHAIVGRDLSLRVVNPANPRNAFSASIVLLKLTSGTTGTPRAIRFTAAQIATDCHQVCDTMGITAADLNFAAIPLEHSYGFSNLITPLLLRGVPMVVTEDRFPRAILTAIEATGATVFPGTPVFYQYLADLEAAAPSKLRLCISAGAPLPLAVWQKFRERFGISIHVFYGSSECGGICYDRTGDFACDGFVGQPMLGVTVNPFDDSGRIEVRSAAVGDGYFPDEDPDILRSGRFVPSDLVRFQDEGLVVSGRASDFINVGGRKLNPFEVEQRLASIPGIRQIVVFGVPSAVRGEEPIACVVGEGIDKAEVLRLCAQSLPAWQTPRDVWIVAALPVSERGKVSRRELAEQYVAANRT